MKIVLSCLILTGFFCDVGIAYCSHATTLTHVPLSFYSHNLGNFTVYLSPTLNAIQQKEATSGSPYYEKPWTGDCPNGLGAEDGYCTEFTVYPNTNNFSPNLMNSIKKYNHGRVNRGEVRILTNASETRYVYTLDHENTFCGPYRMNDGAI